MEGLTRRLLEDAIELKLGLVILLGLLLDGLLLARRLVLLPARDTLLVSHTLSRVSHADKVRRVVRLGRLLVRLVLRNLRSLLQPLRHCPGDLLAVIRPGLCRLGLGLLVQCSEGLLVEVARRPEIGDLMLAQGGRPHEVRDHGEEDQDAEDLHATRGRHPRGLAKERGSFDDC